MFIIDTIKKLKNSKRILFTTPSHLSGGIIPSCLKNLLGRKIFYTDFSEIEGLDNLKRPVACLKKSQNWASKIYETKQTFYLVNGSSSGILAFMLANFTNNDKIIVARNAHESIINGLILTGAVPIWLIPEQDENFGIAKGVTLSQVEKLWGENKDAKALIITSPTYEGTCSEVREIANFCKKNNILFFVDEAHGALFPFSKLLPDSAISLGADACVQSLHKTTPSLNGTALLHIGKISKIDTDKIQQALNLVNTTSPSWVLIASIEAAIEYLTSESCKKEIERLILNIKNLIKENSDYEFVTADNHDVTKLLFSKKGLSGKELSDLLFENNIENELETNVAVLCLCGIGTTNKKLKKLSRTLKKIHFRIKNNAIIWEEASGYGYPVDEEANREKSNEYILPEMKLSPKVAFNTEYEIIDKNNSTGRIIAENITPYPPCIPVLIYGEVIQKEHLKYIHDKKIKVIK